MISSIILIKVGHVYTGSYFSTLGLIMLTFATTFLAPTAPLPENIPDVIVSVQTGLERSTFVSYRTGCFCILLSILNFAISLKTYQLMFYHASSLVMLIVSSFTVYMDVFITQPQVMVSSIVINGLGILLANTIILSQWKFNDKVIGHSEKARKEVEELNKTLEDKVQRRTKELSDTNKTLEDKNVLLSDINRRAERDLALAVNVQRNFYPRVAPEVSDWEIAYVFNPMAGVSGDLYDFWSEGDKFKGCCLFDVSGHGIASGLVTMLSKTIISREFERGKNKSLTKIMLSINEAISQDKGDIENYLTGVILRIEGDKVEYVNGAHPVMLCRSGSSGKVTPCALPGEDAGGSLIGIRELPASFTGINFSVKPGDSLMIYTDCLYESRNKEGIEFGAENVAEIFSKVGNGTAQDQLARVIKQFMNYTDGVPLNDDLTVIVLKKL
ncbi:MAG: SpoIIE family protein phosphatase [Treponemataceae bacterium]